jgi:PAS domain S-box-containing protein
MSSPDDQADVLHQLASARARYQRLLETVSDGIHVLNDDGDLIEASASFYRMLGYSPQDPPKLHLSDWDPQWSPSDLRAVLVDVMVRPAVFEARHRRRDGQMIDVEVNARGVEVTARLGKGIERRHVDRSQSADLSGVRALVVDDNATSRAILTTRLNSWGMRASVAENGSAAMRALEEAVDQGDPFRVAVIDMQMPGIDGETLGRIIKAHARLVDTRMLMLTSLGTRGDAARCRAIGFNGFATKPVRYVELKTLLSQALAEPTEVPPAPSPSVARPRIPETRHRFAGCTARILLAEDHITNQHVALGLLRKMGLSADAVANGEEAVRAVETLPYDLVLMDVQMPHMDGFEATRQIRNAGQNLPIIAMTARAMRGDRERCLEADMNDYVSKPVSPQALADALVTWLPKLRAEEPA